ncbi:MAG: DUF393 domain-containing protein [Pseudomonadota bacterium]
MENKKPFQVYFDGSCPLCQKEIGLYQRMRGGEAIKWVDVSDPNALSHVDDLSCSVAMKRFHIRQADGTLVSGGRAFPELWKQLPTLRWIGLISSVPPISWLAVIAYQLFLPLRPRLQRLLFGSA